MAWVRILADGVVHDGAGGTYPAGAVVDALQSAAENLVASGYAEGADAPAPHKPTAPTRKKPSKPDEPEADL